MRLITVRTVRRDRPPVDYIDLCTNTLRDGHMMLITGIQRSNYDK
jgi:hypothetical protein